MGSTSSIQMLHILYLLLWNIFKSGSWINSLYYIYVISTHWMVVTALTLLVWWDWLS